MLYSYLLPCKKVEDDGEWELGHQEEEMQLRIWGKPKLGRASRLTSAPCKYFPQNTTKKTICQILRRPKYCLSQMRPEQNFVHRKYLKTLTFHSDLCNDIKWMTHKDNNNVFQLQERKFSQLLTAWAILKTDQTQFCGRISPSPEHDFPQNSPHIDFLSYMRDCLFAGIFSTA